MIIAIARSVDSSGSIIMREALTAKTWEFLATRPLDRIFIFANSGFNFRTLFHGLRTSLLARPSNPFIKNIHPSNLSKSTCFLHPPSFASLSSSSFSLSLSLPRVSNSTFLLSGLTIVSAYLRFFSQPPHYFAFLQTCVTKSTNCGSEFTLRGCASCSSVLDGLV